MSDDSEDNAEKVSMEVEEKKSTVKKAKKTRYVLFIGNLAYKTSEEDLRKHFSKKITVRDVRLVKDKQTNQPKGCAFVEFPDEKSYQKALLFDRTMLDNRRISVQYTGGKKAKTLSKAHLKKKNLKLQALKKNSVDKGKTKTQKRAERRAKKKNASIESCSV